MGSGRGLRRLGSSDARDRLLTSGLPISDPESLVDVELPTPELRPRDVLVAVQAVSVNPVDVKRRSGLGTATSRWCSATTRRASCRRSGPRCRRWPSATRSGTPATSTRQGSNAELQAVDERIVALRPGSLSFAEAAALPLTAITAWETLFERFRLTAGLHGSCSIMGAAGGVGSIMIQLAKQLTSVGVLATATRPESRDWVTRARRRPGGRPPRPR